MGRGTAFAVAGASVCLLGVILTQLGGSGIFSGLLVGIIGVAVSFAGAVDEGETARTTQPR